MEDGIIQQQPEEISGCGVKKKKKRLQNQVRGAGTGPHLTLVVQHWNFPDHSSRAFKRFVLTATTNL